MRRHIPLTVILTMIMAFGLAGAAGVYAQATPTDIGGTAGHGTGGATIQEFAGAASAERAARESRKHECMDHAALVMFRSEQPVSKKKAKKSLSSGEAAIGDIQIEEIWYFDADRKAEPTGVTAAGTVRKGGSASIPYKSVALVTSKKLSTERLVAKMRARDDVLYAEPNYRVHAYSVNDPYFGYQWSMQGGAKGSAAYHRNTPNVEAVWDKGTKGSRRIVAIVDTGVDYSHPDLKNNMWHNTHYPTLKGEYGFDFSGGDDDPMDENGHGTHCAGIIGAQGNNGIGTSGVNQKIRIMALRTLDADGSAWLSHEIAAYNYINTALDLGEPVQAINNSWGGGEYSAIFENLINIVGKKGAISVFAAGNEGMDNDWGGIYPADIDSPYMITVAATKEDGGLVNFSNYGKETVDMAAPGTDILSTVPFGCYNPSIYGSSQSKYSSGFNDYSKDAGWESVPDLAGKLYLNGELYDWKDGRITISRSDEGFDPTGSGSNGSVYLEAKGLKANDLICIPIPYQITKDTKAAPYFSVMSRAEGDFGGLIGAVDVPQGTSLDLGALGDRLLVVGTYIYPDDFDNWSHLSGQTMDEFDLEDVQDWAAKAKEDDPDPLARELVLLIYSEYGGSGKVNLDDMGLSLQDITRGPDYFGKYEFMSGTSMATPFVSGAVALKAKSESKSFRKKGAVDLINRITALAKTDTMPIIAGGSFDFTKKPKERGPRINSIKVDKAGGTITISGAGLKPSTGLKVQIGPSMSKLKTARIDKKTHTKKKVVIKDKHWVNNVETVMVTGYKGMTASRSDVYLVGGKKAFTPLKNASDVTTGEAMATNGKSIFYTDSVNRTIWKIRPGKPAEVKEVAKIELKKVFGSKLKPNGNATYTMRFGSDLVYMKGKLYTVVEYGEADASEPEYEEWIIFNKGEKSASKRDEEAGAEEESTDGGELAIYSSKMRLVSIDVKSGKVRNLGRLPSDLEKTGDYAMAAYKGKLYFMGGYNYSARKLTKKVKIFDPAKAKGKRWAAGRSLPSPRAGGKAVASGGKLIYTLGYSKPLPAGTTENSEVNFRFPANLTYNGKKWSVSRVKKSKRLEPFFYDAIVDRGGKKYAYVTASVSAVKNGLVYMGMPVNNYGDVFFYNVSKDRFTDSGINFISKLEDNEIHGIAVKNKLYGFDMERVYSVKLK